MVVNNFDVNGSSRRPDETHTPLIVDANAVLTGSIALERFQAIARRRSQEIERQGSVQLRQLSLGDRCDRSKAPGTLAFEQCLRVLAPERLDHEQSVLRAT